MSLVSAGYTLYPSPIFYPSSYAANSADMRFQAQTTRVGRIVSIPASCGGKYVRAVKAHFGTAATPNEMRCGIYTIDSSGNPTSTGYDGSGDNYGSALISANTTATFTLSRDVALTPGDIVAVVVEPNDADAVDCYIGSVTSAATYGCRATRRYVSSWASTGVHPSIGAVCTDGSTYLPMTGSSLTTGSGNYIFNVNSTPDENAMKLTVPMSCRAVGVWSSNYIIAGADAEFVLYYGASSVSTGVIDGDQFSPTNTHPHIFMFSSSATLSAGDTCYVSMKPSSTTSAYLYYATIASNEWKNTFGVPGTHQRAYRTDGGSWDESDTTTIIGLGLVLDQLDTGGGGGGLLVHGGMTGGMNG